MFCSLHPLNLQREPMEAAPMGAGAALGAPGYPGRVEAGKLEPSALSRLAGHGELDVGLILPPVATPLSAHPLHGQDGLVPPQNAEISSQKEENPSKLLHIPLPRCRCQAKSEQTLVPIIAHNRGFYGGLVHGAIKGFMLLVSSEKEKRVKETR